MGCSELLNFFPAAQKWQKSSALKSEVAEVTKAFISRGVSPRMQLILSAPQADSADSRTYRQPSDGPLLISLAFANQGARLQLTAHGPNPQRFEQAGSSTFTLEIPQAAAGDWT